ncbi:asparagine synthase-related protein [Georgenia sp. H159]|uniref:asparagine synthase-related protein n=1 Tax=Georgenia sp. H159 TaxID=3076115 RepID=UPI002D7791C1|nr:asparagine synthase-related protein [Georgenia sp. H159]
MSCELLVIAGSRSHGSIETRRAALMHATEAVPGFVGSSVKESESACAALVATAPDAGTLSRCEQSPAGERLTIATNRRGLAAAGTTRVVGAEGGHVSILLAPDGRVELSTDGVGFIPCYWGPLAGGIAISTHLASLVSLGVAADVDERGVIEYLAMHHPLGTRTLLRDARMLAAGGRLRWEPGSQPFIDVRPIFVPSDEALDDDEAVAAFRTRWPQVVVDALEGPGTVALGLSGGLDSRAIAEAAVQSGIRPLTYTYGTPPTHEPVVAARVADALHLQHVRIPVTSDDMLAGGLSAVDRLDGAHSPSEMYELWFQDALRAMTGTVINGLAGGPLWGDDKAVGLTDPAAVLERQWRRYAADARTVSRFLGSGLGEDVDRVLRDSLRESLFEWDLEGRDDTVLYWKVANRQFRWGNMLTNALRRSGLRTEAPFLDSRSLELTARLTPAQRRNGGLYLRIHREMFPVTAAIPRSDDGNPPRALNHVYWSGETSYLQQLTGLARRHPIAAMRRGTRLGSHMVREALRDRTGIAGPADRSDRRRSVFPADVWLRTSKAYADRLCSLLELGDHPLFSESAVAAELAAVRAGRPTVPALALGRVAAARAWLSDYERRAAARGAAG